ncbi:hypothetical protein MLD38_014587 [Melastoma candidum]|uniref:Uncharacterized protein n=1 Tax=Melastoma candidum TaxID=119954 RepID=A0ACB9RGZ8_9MYRT|nr:hypothetical protein MLD38_014587 [Melastoma candidum]
MVLVSLALCCVARCLLRSKERMSGFDARVGVKPHFFFPFAQLLFVLRQQYIYRGKGEVGLKEHFVSS